VSLDVVSLDVVSLEVVPLDEVSLGVGSFDVLSLGAVCLLVEATATAVIIATTRRIRIMVTTISM
jgi:hypothetical protein